jgi:hypothetical protein
LTSTFWPVSSTPVPCNLPADFFSSTKVFERFYMSRHNGRKLTWHSSMVMNSFALKVRYQWHSCGINSLLEQQHNYRVAWICEHRLTLRSMSLMCRQWQLSCYFSSTICLMANLFRMLPLRN